MASSCFYTDCIVSGFGCGTFRPTTCITTSKLLLRKLRSCGYLNVSYDCPTWDGEGMLTFCSMLFAVAYWYIWTVLLPRLQGYKLEEAVEVLADGTSITKFVKVRKS
jgi:hypothetical protein